MRFYLDNQELVFSVPASLPYSNRTKLVQVKDYSASGITHVEDFEVVSGSLNITFQELPQNDYTALLDWHVNVAEGMKNVFGMEDDLGQIFNVRFMAPEIAGENTGTSVDNTPLYSVTFELELEN